MFEILNLVENILRVDFQKICQARDAIKILGLCAQEFFVDTDFVFGQRAFVAGHAAENFFCQSNYLEI